MDSGITRCCEHSFDGPVESCGRDWMCGAAAINVPAISLPLYCAAFLNRLTGKVGHAWARETIITLFEHAGQIIRDDLEGKRRVRPQASFDAIGHAQMASFQEE
jgi:hypothetical protein